MKSVGKPELAVEFLAIRKGFESPEHINDSKHTAPSNRIAEIVEGYQKRIDGIQAMQQIGLEAVRKECPLFNDWITELEQAPINVPTLSARDRLPLA